MQSSRAGKKSKFSFSNGKRKPVRQRCIEAERTFPSNHRFQLLKPRESLALTSVSLVVRERRRSTKDEDEHSLVVVVVGRGRSRDAGLPPLGDSAPVNRRGLISMLPSKEHGGGTVRRGSEWVPRGEPEESGALFFIAFFFFGSPAARKRNGNGKEGPPFESEQRRELFIYLFVFFLLVSLFLPPKKKTCARSIARGSSRQQELLSMPRRSPLERLLREGRRRLLL